MQFKYFLAISAAAVPLAIGLASPAAAQQITSGIEGSVTDSSGAAISSAEVTITDTRTGASRTITTGTGGTFSANGLITGGPYTVSVNASGFEGQTINDIQTSLQGSTSLTFSLAQGAGDIVVTGTRVKLTQLAVGPGQSFSQVALESAPSFGRDIRDIIRLDPRVSLDRDDGGTSGSDRISCLGGNDRGNAFTVDGISQSDVFGLNDNGFSSRSSAPIPYDAIRETQVQFAPFDVDYGQFTGCAINVVTKSGSNKWHGSMFGEYSNSDMRAKSFTDRGTVRTVAPIKPDKRWGASLGGAIIPDTLFFFAAYEHQEAGQSQDDGPAGAGYANELAGVPVAAFNDISAVLKTQYGIDTGPLVTSRPYKNDRYFGRIDWQITDRHRLELTGQKLKETTLKTDDFFTGATSPQVVGLNTFHLSGTDSKYYSGRLYSNWTDTFSTELRYSRSEVQDIQDPFGGGEAQLGNPIPRIIVGIDNPTGPDGAVLAGPGTSRSANDLKTTINFYRAIAKLDAGAHKLKVGFELNQGKFYNIFVQNATGTLVFKNINDLRLGLLSPGLGNNNTTTTPANVIPGNTEGAFINYTASGNVNDAAAIFDRSSYSIYAQDEWSVNDRLKVVIGARADWYDGSHPGANATFNRRYGFSNSTGFSNIDTVFMPRLGMTYDAGDFGVFNRVQLHGGVGIFSGGDPLVWFSNVFSNDGATFATANTQASGCPTGQISVLSGGTFTGIPACIKTAASTSAAAALGNTQAIDPNIKMTKVLRANFGFSTDINLADKGFLNGWNLAADFIYSRYNNPFNLVDLAQAIDPSRGLSGYAIDGRPIYRAIDPSVAGCTATLTAATPVPTYTGVTSACFTGVTRGAELMLTNAPSYTSKIASVILSKSFDRGVFTQGGSVFLSLGYAYTDSQDRRNLYNSTAGSNYGQTAAFDRQNPASSTGFFQSRHNITASVNFSEEFFGEYKTRLGVTYVGRAGRPYSLTFTGNGVFNATNGGLTTNDNALVYLPSSISDPNISPTSNMTEVQKLINFASNLECAKPYLGKSIARNTCTNDWYNDVDLSFSQEIPGPGRFFGLEDKIKLFATFDNFLNFLSSGGNLNYRRNFFGVQDIASTSGVDAQGRYIITSAAGSDTFDSDKFVNVTSSVWRLKVGVNYQF